MAISRARTMRTQETQRHLDRAASPVSRTMPDKCEVNATQPLDPTNQQLLPAPRYRIDLKSLFEVRREMARVYRDVRTGQLGSSDGARLVFMLGQIGKMIELSDLEERLTRLEGLTHGNA